MSYSQGNDGQSQDSEGTMAVPAGHLRMTLRWTGLSDRQLMDSLSEAPEIVPTPAPQPAFVFQRTQT